MLITFVENFRLKTGDVPAGKQIEVDDALAKGFIKNGYAKAVEQPQPVIKLKRSK
jgi:hypothetical protein